MNEQTREAWLIAATSTIRGWFTEVNLGLAENIRLSVGFPSKSALSRKLRRIGECWSSKSASDGYFHIFISPLLGDAVDVLATLVHELVHVSVGTEAGHKAPFIKAMKQLGLEGKPTATVAGEQLRTRLNGLLTDLGPYPHGALQASDLDAKKQSTRLLKAQCPTGDSSAGKLYTVRITKVHLETFGAPICPGCLKRMVDEKGGDLLPGHTDDSTEEDAEDEGE